MRKSQFLMGCAFAAGLSACAAQASAQEFSYKGSITSDLRFTVPGQDMPEDLDKVRFDRTDNTFRFTGAFTWGVVDAVADISVTYSGQSDVYELYTDRSRQHVDPLYFESEALSSSTASISASDGKSSTGVRPIASTPRASSTPSISKITKISDAASPTK